MPHIHAASQPALIIFLLCCRPRRPRPISPGVVLPLPGFREIYPYAQHVYAIEYHPLPPQQAALDVAEKSAMLMHD